VELSGSYLADLTFKGSDNDYLLLIYGRLIITEPKAVNHLEIDGLKEQAKFLVHGSAPSNLLLLGKASLVLYMRPSPSS
jgi:hypothetical protein